MIVRALFPLVALVTAALSIAVDVVEPPADGRVCRLGGCRFDQIYSYIESRGATPATLSALVQEDSSNPLAWADYADYLARTGHIDLAATAFARAVDLGGGLAPILVRAASFAFTHGRVAQGLQLVPRILEETPDYDEMLFSYLKLSGMRTTDALDTLIPASTRAARSWLAWTLNHSNDDDIAATWAWMHRHGLSDQKSASDAVRTLWQHGAHCGAQRMWLDWLGARAGRYPQAELLANTRFETEPSATPFDWDLSQRPGIAYTRRDGLEITFLGQANVVDAGVGQYAVVTPGRYEMTLDASAANVSTDQGVFVEIEDAEKPARLHVESAALFGTVARRTTTLAVIVPAETHVLRVRLARKASLKFDNALAGTLYIHRLALERSAKTGTSS